MVAQPCARLKAPEACAEGRRRRSVLCPVYFIAATNDEGSRPRTAVSQEGGSGRLTPNARHWSAAVGQAPMVMISVAGYLLSCVNS